MTLVTSIAEPGAFSLSAKPARSRQKTPVDRASYAMLQLYRTNLEVRLQCVDEESLSDHQRRISARVGETLRTVGQANATDSGLEWDEIYKAERLSTALLSGAQLRQEIIRRLDELADEKASEAGRFRQEYEALAKGARDAPAPDDSVLRAFLLRLIESLQWAAKRRYMVRPL